MKNIVVFAALCAAVSAAAATKKDAPPTKLFIFREDCYDRFLAFDIDPDCVKFTVSTGLGFAIILGPLILKFPQILKIMASRSAEGLSAFSNYVEIISYLGVIGNSRRLELPFSVYGEGVFINFQNFIILILIWNYNKSIFMLEKLAFLTIAFAYGFLLFEGSFMTPEAWDMIASAQIVLVVLTKLPQIITTFSKGSTGQLAFVTCFLQFAGIIARTGTVLFQSDDFMYKLQFMVAVVFNTITMIQFAMYWNSGPKKGRAKLSGPGAAKARTSSNKNKLE